ncbi:MAG: hypothetical protein WCR72_04235 [Bacteroidota bacterium]
MSLHFLHTLSGIAILLALGCKVLVHFYLDYIQEQSSGFNSVLLIPLQYLLPYKSPVEHKYQGLKYLCNSFFALACLSLILNIIFGVLVL